MARTGKPAPHTNLLVLLSKAITQENLGDIKTELKRSDYGGFLAGELEKLDSAQKILDKMEHKGVFKVKNQPQKTVDYRKLKAVMKQCYVGGASDEIESTEKELTALGYYVEREDQADSVAAMETEPSYNVNNSRSDKCDACPSNISLSDSGGGVIPDENSYAKGKGYLLYINNFENSGEPRRKGSEKDKDQIEALFEEDDDINLSFKCAYEKDLTKPQLLKLLKKTSEKLAKGNYSSFFLIISSHGEQFVVQGKEKEATFEGIATIDKQFITEEELTKPFLGDELKKLNDKPKVFIIQACRAPRLDSSDDMESGDMDESPENPTPPSMKKPVNADMLISYATSKGTKAWRNDDGTWYISELCKGIKKYSKKKHLADILVRVNGQIALRESTEGCAKQMSCHTSTLTKDFWL